MLPLQPTAWVVVFALAATVCCAVVGAASVDDTSAPICRTPATEEALRSKLPAIVVVHARGAAGSSRTELDLIIGTGRSVTTAAPVVEIGQGIEVVVGADRYDAVVVAAPRPGLQPM